jgi:hypothetical protein
MDLGQETAVTVKDKVWVLGRFTMGVLEGFRDYVREQEGDPLDGLDMLVKSLPPAEAIAMVSEAKERKRQLRAFTLACPVAQEHLKTEFGGTKIIHLLLLEKQPKATMTDAFEVLIGGGGEKLAEILQRAQGEVAVKNGQGPAGHPSPGTQPSLAGPASTDA